MRNFLSALSISTSLLIAQNINAFEGKRYSFGSGDGGYQGSFGGNGEVVFDEDNPDPITTFFESEKTKAQREMRKSLKENISHIFSELVPKYEKSEWKRLEPSISRDGSYGRIDWTAGIDNEENLKISYENLLDSNEYKTLSEFIDSYSKEMLSQDNYKYSINILNKSNESTVIEIDRFKKGTGDFIKKNTQIKFIEKWIVAGNWLIGLSYSITSSANEKFDSWNELKNTWENRFAKIHFSNTSPQ